jgi:hypothetical protein
MNQVVNPNFVRACALRAKNFLSEGIFLPKTCCTNTTNLYNYGQVELKNFYVPLGNTFKGVFDSLAS